MLRISEIFHSIQGESSYAGLPCTMVRLAGCDLRCRYCDTRYAWEEGAALTVAAVLDQVAALGCRRVEITGGEPLLQAETVALATQLLEQGYTVLIETGGHRAIDVLPEGVRRIVDMKTPSSGVSERMDFRNLERLRPGDEVKFVVGDRADFDWAVALVERYGVARRAEILFSPIHGGCTPRELAAWILASRLDARLNLQLHKIIWGAEARGV